MQTDVIDLYQIHRPDLFAHPADVAATLTALRDAGKIREVGVSNHTPAQVAALAAHLPFPLASNQPEYSALHLDPMRDGTFDDCMRTGTVALAWSPLGGGRLATGDDLRPELLDVLDRLARREGVDRGAIAIAFVLAHPGGTDCDHRLAEPPAHRHQHNGTRRDARARGRVLDHPGFRRSPTSMNALTRPDVPEISWFSALCDDDYEFLGVPDPALASSWEHCSDIVATADRNGFDNVLLPSGYTLGIDSTAFAAAIATHTERINLLLAVRMGEMWLPQLARQLASIDQFAHGRLCINIISSDIPGEELESAPRYQRTREWMQVLRQLLNGQPIDFHGEFVDLTLEPPRATTVNGSCPPMYFGGFSPAAKDVAAGEADVFLTWPDTVSSVAATVEEMTALGSRAIRPLTRLRPPCPRDRS